MLAVRILPARTSTHQFGDCDPGGGSCESRLVVRLTDQTLSCTARALVPKPERHDTRLHVRRAMRVACRRDGLTFRAGSAGGPKPGRASFCGGLGRHTDLGWTRILGLAARYDSSCFCANSSASDCWKNATAAPRYVTIRAIPRKASVIASALAQKLRGTISP